jgi:ankyrin repeat protein
MESFQKIFPSSSMNYDELQHGIEDNLPIPNRDELWEAIKNKDLKKYTPGQIEQGMLQKDEHESTLYHFAADYGYLDQIPKELLTAENLLKPNSSNETCLHFAAMGGHLDQIPKELLTAENLLHIDINSRTCLHLVAIGGHLDKIPQLSYETLTELIDFETKDSSYLKEAILETLNELLEKKLKRLEIIARSQTINHDTDIL